MKAYIVIAVMFFIVGFAGLSLASNQTYISDEEYLAYKEKDVWSPYQARSQQQFTFISGIVSIIVGFVVLTGVVLAKTWD